jgi:acyl carrier protein
VSIFSTLEIYSLAILSLFKLSEEFTVEIPVDELEALNEIASSINS